MATLSGDVLAASVSANLNVYADDNSQTNTKSGAVSLDDANLQGWGLNEFQSWVYAYIRAQILDDDEDDLVLIIPPGLGKSHSAKEVIAKTAKDTQYFYATHTYENRKERAEKIQELNSNLNVVCFPPAKDCPIYGNKEECQDKASKLLRALDNAGLSLKQAHRMLGDALPDHDGGDCPYTVEYPTEEEKREADVLIGSHHHARAEENVAGRRVVLDEFTGGADAHTVEFGSNTGRSIPETITPVIESCEQSNIDSWNELITTTLHTDGIDQEVATLLDYLNEIGGSDLRIHDPTKYTDEGATGIPHVKTPELLYTLATADYEELGDVYRFETDDAIILVERNEDAQDTIVFVEKSQLTEIAKSVTALDGMDKLERWNLYYGLNKKSPFTDGDLSAYLDVAFDDLRFIMPSDRDSLGPRPYNGWYVTPTQDGGMIRLIMAKHGSDLGIISTKNAFEKYEESSDPDVQIIPGLVSKLTDSPYTMHYGATRSNRDFEVRDIVIVIGSNHLPYRKIRRECLLRGITPEIDRDADETYQGRTREIRDAMLEEDTMQAFMRARKSDSSDDGSIVYVNTNTIPAEYESAFDPWEFDKKLLNSRSRLDAFDAIQRLEIEDLIQPDDRDANICKPIVGNSVIDIINDITNNIDTLSGFTQSMIVDRGIATRRTINNTMRHFQEKGFVEKVKESRGPKPASWTYNGIGSFLRKKTTGTKLWGQHPSIEEVYEMREKQEATTLDPEDFDSKEEWLLAQGECPSIKAWTM